MTDTLTHPDVHVHDGYNDADVPADQADDVAGKAKPARRPATARRSGSRKNVGVTKTTVLRVLDVRGRVGQMDDAMVRIVSSLSGCEADPDALTVALLGDTSWVAGLETLHDLTTMDMFDAVVEVADMATDTRNAAWSTLTHFDNTGAQGRLHTSIGKAAKQIVAAANNLEDAQRDAVSRVLDVISD